MIFIKWWIQNQSHYPKSILFQEHKISLSLSTYLKYFDDSNKDNNILKQMNSVALFSLSDCSNNHKYILSRVSLLQESLKSTLIVTEYIISVI